MVLRKRGLTFLICFSKREFPQKKGGSNPGGNYGVTLPGSKVGKVQCILCKKYMKLKLCLQKTSVIVG